jgi:hypothetical protein
VIVLDFQTSVAGMSTVNRGVSDDAPPKPNMTDDLNVVWV